MAMEAQTPLGKPAGNPEAMSKHALLVVRTTACHAPEKTSMTGTAEGIVDGQRRSIPLKLIQLSTPGTYGVIRQWPGSGVWVVKVVARNPEYKDYATGALVRFDADSPEWASVKHSFHEPTNAEVESLLTAASRVDSASIQ